MYTSTPPSQHYPLTHGSVQVPVSGQSLNRAYNQPREDALFRSFTPGQNHNLTLITGASSGPSHAAVSNRSRFPLGPKPSVQAHGQSSTWNATREMTGHSHPQFAASNRNLDGSLLCSPWSAQRLKTPSPQLPAAALSSATVVPQPMSHHTLQPFWPPDTGDIVQPLGQGFELSSSMLTYPTPGLTPISTIESIPTNSVVLGGDGYIGTSPPQWPLPAYRQNRRIPQNPLDGLQGSVGQFSASDMLGVSDPYLISDDTDVPPAFAYLPEWTSSTNTTFGEYSDANKFQYNAASFEPVEQLTQFRDTVDPSELGSLENFASLDDGDSIINSIAENAQPDLPDVDDPFGVLTKADALTFNNPDQHAWEPFIPDSVLEIGDISLGGLDGPVFTAEHGAEDRAFPGQSYLQSVSDLTDGRRGDPGRRNTSRDQELIELRMRGVSYRDIKQKHGFDVAESTLRGRIRSLTKAKEERLRKPVWKAEDVSLLCSCVIEFAIQHNLPVDVVGSFERPVLLSEQTMNKISWKRVAEMMAERGSYHYGNATTKKKYNEVRDEQRRGFAL